MPQIAGPGIRHLLKDMAASVDAGRVDLQHSGDDRLASAAQFLRIILANLVSNALKYPPPQSMFELQSTGADGQRAAPGVCLSVRSRLGDAGVPDAAQLFSPYCRSDGAQRLPGAGLGLCLSQNLASKIGSTIDMQVAGDEFIFSLQVGTVT
jgi:K+-sensing histidine kinase KdpD